MKKALMSKLVVGGVVATVSWSSEALAANQELENAIAHSDDYSRHKTVFLKVSQQLIDEGQCKLADFVKTGGWWKSTTTYKKQPVYFTYCGGMHIKNRLYLDASNSKVFK